MHINLWAIFQPLKSAVVSSRISKSTEGVLVTSKNEDVQINNEGARVAAIFSSSHIECLDDPGQINSVVRGRIWPILEPFECLCISSLPARMKRIRLKQPRKYGDTIFTDAQ